MTKEEFWAEFLRVKNLDRSTTYLDCFHFDMSKYWANALLALVLEGKKRATASSIDSFRSEGMDLPKPGDYSIVTDWAGQPACVIETTAVTVLPFCEMTYDICSREGEDDNLESWRQGHINFFTEEGVELGYEFSEDMPVVFEDFRVVYKAGDKEDEL